MKHYINNITKEIYAFESDGSQDAFIKDGLVPISDADLATLRASQVIPPTHQQLRAAEYTKITIGEQFAMQYDDQVNGTTTWIDWQDGIKAAIPKI